ncbi:vacuolar membrane-associated protein iml1 [Saxophila tyrrhenica]|uniref:Vacuolar membrane-associated protein iml1 n=1 Tax=Saxophila tyrrhenica TaxID=1690608 RepID=A0AAV9NY85_9PEZI|nr:vacuolar membrane-associated protein iml1 [Saxophila tyrrhenica]
MGLRRVACTVVLHESTLSKEHVLCPSSLLPPGSAAYLVAANTKRLCVLAWEPWNNPDEVSVHVSLARQLGFDNRMKATIEVVEDIEEATATHVELFFRDQHLSRSDMWHLESQIDATVLYQGQMLSYLGSHVANVENVYIAGNQVDSACILHPRTKLIFRSGSARYIILVQVSREMLEGWSNGDLLYEGLLNGFLPDLFRRWDSLKVRHHVSVILFGRRLLQPGPAEPNEGGRREESEDFFHVAASDVPSHESSQILQTLKRIFNGNELPRDVCLAAKGNMLQAINIAAADFIQVNSDPHLASTGAAIIAVTAGSGVFETDHELLRRTTRLLMGNSVGVDLVSLGPRPLHPVPLFQYSKDVIVEYALPHWADISYWRSHTSNTTHWLLDETDEETIGVVLPFVEVDRRSFEGQPSGMFEDFDKTVFSHAARSPTYQAPTHSTSRFSTVGANSSDVSSNTVRPIDADGGKRLAKRSAEHTASERPQSPRPESLLSFRKSKKTATAPHPLLQMGRTTSAGTKTAALSSGVASANVSVQHTQHGRDASSGSDQSNTESSSGLAKQIRASLRKKPSQISLAHSHAPEAVLPSDPIAIRTSLEQSEEDPASQVEKAVMQQSRSAGLDNIDSLSATPRARGKLPEGMVHLEEQHHAAVSPWLTLLNPCNPRKDNMRVASEYRQWQNVFPTAVGPDTFRYQTHAQNSAMSKTLANPFALLFAGGSRWYQTHGENPTMSETLANPFTLLFAGHTCHSAFTSRKSHLTQ